MPHFRRLDGWTGVRFANRLGGTIGAGGHFGIVDDVGIAVWDGERVIGASGPLTPPLPDPIAEVVTTFPLAMRVLDDGEVWLCGDEGVGRWDGSDWRAWGASEITGGAFGLDCSGIAGSGRADVWIVGPSDASAEPVLCHWDGSTWSCEDRWEGAAFSHDLNLIDDRLFWIADNISTQDVWVMDVAGGTAPRALGLGLTAAQDIRPVPGGSRFVVPGRRTNPADPTDWDIVVSVVIDGERVVEEIEHLGNPVPVSRDVLYFVEGTQFGELVVSRREGGTIVEVGHVLLRDLDEGTYGGYGILVDGVLQIDGPYGWLTLP